MTITFAYLSTKQTWSDIMIIIYHSTEKHGWVEPMEWTYSQFS